MAALNFVELSKPFVEDGPCGPDLEDDVDFMNVTARLEVALPTAYFRRDDEGRQVAFDRTSIEFPAAFADLGKLMARSQDLRLFVLAAKLSILNRDVGGFVDCLSAMADILGENWDAVHPRAMDGDVIMREVALQGLDELPTVVLPLQHAPLFTSRRIGAFIFRSQLVATGETKLVEGEQHPDAGAIQAALAEVDVDELAAILARINAARDALARLRSTWLEKVGVDHPLGFPRLAALLDQIAGFLDAAAARRVPGHQAAVAAPAANDAQNPAASAPSFGPGSLSSIIQVKDTLAACLGYFRRTEPSSPAVLLIGQAQQLIGKSLIEVIQIMFPDHIDKAVLEIGELRRFRLPLERLPAPDGSEAGDGEEGYAGGSDDSYESDGAYGSESDGEAADDAEAAVPKEEAHPPGDPAVAAIVIGNRTEAVSAMKAVAAFYRQVEPSHPTPLLMDKACALAQHDFMSLLGNILPEVAQLPESDS
ncbi:type VI secretion system ImpA family N-terminal domain-containing protein [Bosea sp. (in: a-proteobacteria)]|uniref:type VI secretion system protein TssA n=2 Tax=Bosea sp. (in: a-proteobacteria) TaxID=1871050 RepID=UPI001AD40D3C|nr:type VI secretion system ImpA family N-terminal domain-containing protein [Bosea sp. (in: a-proteobacteria)]MBN9442105.1 type VI secretion system ImpA family N-terminal domain-containing protein [Bosea sp. (in: a-proteobacteria)]